MGTLRSGCSCGAVQLEIEGDPAVQAYCHCSSCRGWLGAPIHAATLWPTPNVKVVKGADKLGVYKKTEASHRQFCTSCGTPVLVRHPGDRNDRRAGRHDRGARVHEPTLHVHYGEKVLAVRDGLPKFKDFPKDFGGSGDVAARVGSACAAATFSCRARSIARKCEHERCFARVCRRMRPQRARARAFGSQDAHPDGRPNEP